MFDYLCHLKQQYKNQYRPYYNNLTTSQKCAYDDACKGFLAQSTKIRISGIPVSSVAMLFELIRLDNPWLFFVESISVQYVEGSLKAWIIPVYRMSLREVNESLERLWKIGEVFRRRIESKSDLEKELFIHDSLCRHVIYENSDGFLAHECLGPLLYKKGVCEGIAKAVKFLFDMNSMRAIVVRGDAMDPSCPGKPCPHSWNIVGIESSFYHLDVTFDLTIQAHKMIRYDYYNLSDQEMFVDHSNPRYCVPTCGESMNYYRQNGLFMKTPKDLKKVIYACIESSKSDCIFQLPKLKEFDKVKTKILELTKEAMLSTGQNNINLDMNYNEFQKVFHLHIAYDTR